MARPRAADDFVAIRARMEELRRERLQAQRDTALGPSEIPRYPRNRNVQNGPDGKAEIGLFRVRGVGQARPDLPERARRTSLRVIQLALRDRF